MDILEENEWGGFKSTTEIAADAFAIPSVVGSSGEAEGEEPARDVDGKRASLDTSAPLAVLAAIRLEASEAVKPTLEVMLAEATYEPSPQRQQQQCDNGSSSAVDFDLLGQLPSPATAGNDTNAGDGGIKSTDLFGSMLASAPAVLVQNDAAINNGDCTAASAAAPAPTTVADAGIPTPSEGEQAGEDDDEGDWAAFEQPAPPAAASNFGENDRGATTPSPAVAAEKVDGEWVYVAGEESEDLKSYSGGESNDGAEEPPVGSLEDVTAVDRRGKERRSEMQQQQQQQLGDCDLLSIPLRADCDAGDPGEAEAVIEAPSSPVAKKSDEEPCLSNEGNREVEESPQEASAEAKGQSFGEGQEEDGVAERMEKEKVEGETEGKGEGKGQGRKKGEQDKKQGEEDEHNFLSEPEPLIALPPKGTGSDILEEEYARVAAQATAAMTAEAAETETPVDIGEMTAAAPAGEDLGSKTSLLVVPEAAPASVPAASERGCDEGDLVGVATNGSNLAAPDAAGVCMTDGLDLGNDEGHASFIEAAAVVGDAASPFGTEARKEEEGEERQEGEDNDEWSAFGAEPTPPSAENQQALEVPRQLTGEIALPAGLTSLAADESEGGLPESFPPAPAKNVVEVSSEEGPPLPTPPSCQEAGGSAGHDGQLSPEPSSPPTVLADEWRVFEEAEGGGEAEGEESSLSGDRAAVTGGAAEEQSSSWRAFDKAPLPAAGAAAATAEEWGVFGEEGQATTGSSADGEPVGHTGGDEGRAHDGGDDGKALLETHVLGGGGAGEDRIDSSRGAFDEAPPAAVEDSADGLSKESERVLTALKEPSTTPQAQERTASTVVASPAPAPAPAIAGKDEPQGVAKDFVNEPGALLSQAEGGDADRAAITGCSGSGRDQRLESEDEWGSDFGDFEEAPTTAEEPKPGASATSARVSPPASLAVPRAAPSAAPLEGAAGVTAFPKPPAVAARGLPAASAAAKVAAMAKKRTPGGGAQSSSSAEGGREGPSFLAAMVDVFDRAFGLGNVREKQGPGPGRSNSGGVGEESSLDSLADLAHLLCYAKPTKHLAPATLNTWAKSCILRGILPVPDALSLEDDDGDMGQSSWKGAHVGASPDVVAQPPPPLPAVPPSPPAQTMAGGSGPPPRESSSSSSPPNLVLARGAEVASREVPASSAPPPFAPLAPAGTSAATPPVLVSLSSAPPPVLGRALPAGSAVVQEDASAGNGVHAAAAAAAAAAPAMGSGETAVRSGAGVTTPAVVAAEGTAAFTSFSAAAEHSGAKDDFDDAEFVWSEAPAATPEMPRNPPPRVPLTPPADGGRIRGKLNFTEGSSGDVGASSGDGSSGGGGSGVAAPVTGDPGASADGNVRGEDDGDWSDDPFDSFQSAPPASPPPPCLVMPLSPPLLPGTPSAAATNTVALAAAADRACSPSPPLESSPWNLDFLMAPPVKDGRLSPAPGPWAKVSSAGLGENSSKPLDLVSQALAGFGITSGSCDGGAGAGGDTPAIGGISQVTDNVFSAFDGPRSMAGMPGDGGGGGAKGERDRLRSLDVSDLLRASRLRVRGGGRRASPPPAPLSAAAEARLATLPDLSFMLLTQRIRFPVRAEGEGLL